LILIARRRAPDEPGAPESDWSAAAAVGCLRIRTLDHDGTGMYVLCLVLAALALVLAAWSRALAGHGSDTLG
jgi:hypothetical protein